MHYLFKIYLFLFVIITGIYMFEKRENFNI